MPTEEEKVAETIRDMKESSLSRIWIHVTEDALTFAVLSAFREEFDEKENEANHEELQKKVRSMRYGFVRMRGGYQEEEKGEDGQVVKGEDGQIVYKDPVYKKSLFIPSISREEALELGDYYKQYSIIHKDEEGSFVHIRLADRVVENEYKTGDRDAFTFAVEEFFSELVKGSHRDRRFKFKDIKIEEYFTPNCAAKSLINAHGVWIDFMQCPPDALERYENREKSLNMRILRNLKNKNNKKSKK